MRILRDNEIRELLDEVKQLPENWQSKIRTKKKSGFQHEECHFEIKGESGNVFRIILRQNSINAFDFSVILIFQDKDGKEYRLVRYNGKHPSKHTNKWEKEQGQSDHTFAPAFHIHQATERYQESGYPIDGYAVVTTAYQDFNSALNHFLKENNFEEPKGPQLKLFNGGDFV